MVATVESRSDGKVELIRTLPKPATGVEAKISIAEDKFEELSPVTADPTQNVADLVMLADVNTGAVLNNLRLRYREDDIFTAIGPILIVVNPYKPLQTCSSNY